LKIGAFFNCQSTVFQVFIQGLLLQPLTPMSDDLSHAVNAGRIFFFREPKAKSKEGKRGKGKKNASKREGAKVEQVFL
jgi:hypothetical protein